MQWEDLTGPPVLIRPLGPKAPAKITAPTQVSVPRDLPPLGGQARAGDAEGRDTQNRKVPRAGRNPGANCIATLAEVKNQDTSSVKTPVAGELNAVNELTLSMQRLELRLPKLTSSLFSVQSSTD
jgi:hypothetical protein